MLGRILSSNLSVPPDARLLVGNESRDDAAVYDIGDGRAVISTTDFFMPIVDDPVDFGRIAAANAISDVYAMGGRPLMAIGILGWPVNVLAPEVAAQVLEGGRMTCAEAGILLAGGHSIDNPEPIFGLAVTGLVPIERLKRNDRAQVGDVLFLTKGLGIGLLTTAEKRGKLLDADRGVAAASMRRINDVGEVLGALAGVHAMTDVTGFGLLGHLVEVAEGSGVCAVLDRGALPRLTNLQPYLDAGTVPGGTKRNFAAIADRVGPIEPADRHVLADPQTNGGLLIAVDPAAASEVASILAQAGWVSDPVGRLQARTAGGPWVVVE